MLIVSRMAVRWTARPPWPTMRYYLDNHLKEVVARHEASRDVEVLGLGVGLDLSPYYRRCLAVDLSVPPDMKLFAGIVGWMSGRR